jgi:AcrR family transcriptional regulator
MERQVKQNKEIDSRRAAILTAARWCFLNFGFSKTSLEDIARRANISRTLLYRQFKNKEDIYRAVFVDWLIARHPAAKQAVAESGDQYERLLTVCKVMALDPYSEMVGAPMGRDFLNACARIDPEISERHRQVALQCLGAILGNEEKAEVFILALDGLLTDAPTTDKLERRIQILVAQFTKPPTK